MGVLIMSLNQMLELNGLVFLSQPLIPVSRTVIPLFTWIIQFVCGLSGFFFFFFSSAVGYLLLERSCATTGCVYTVIYKIYSKKFSACFLLTMARIHSNGQQLTLKSLTVEISSSAWLLHVSTELCSFLTCHICSSRNVQPIRSDHRNHRDGRHCAHYGRLHCATEWPLNMWVGRGGFKSWFEGSSSSCLGDKMDSWF